MSELLKEFNFNLTTPIQYHAKDGSALLDGTFLTVKAPSNKQLKDVMRLRQAVAKAAIEQANKSHGDKKDMPSEEVSDESKASGILMLLLSSTDSLDILLDCFRRILVSGCCKLNDEVTFSDALFEQMYEEDFSSLFGRYLHNFFMRSLSQKTKKA
jgi:hypothetical protein